MNLALYRQMFKVHAKSFFSYGIGSAFYLVLIISIFPSIANAPGLNELMESLPKEFLAAFGMEGGFQELSDFIAGEYYGLLYIVILAIFSIMTATQLIARLVDRGSLAYLLSTPNSRTKIALTQALVLCTGLLIIGLFTTLTGIIGADLMIEEMFEQSAFIKMNIVGILVFFVISGYSFLFSSLFNDERRALGLSAILTLLFFGLDMAGKLSEDFEWMRNLSLFSVFEPVEIARGGVDILPVSLALVAAGVLLFTAAIIIFKKRDLPL
ncbi:ABC transporter permease subunit [Pseudalkalibacillus caeni]|uniref:Permease n=1 Tax=Exobacillus caeni TaxID=2574798 RepID=A0A5R9F8Z7_9BACL|nr:ABC transporter permease subunit [Pseudalkalibacillus caeni]TLS38740.1 permease [Pseudalkalibacillus caeni]